MATDRDDKDVEKPAGGAARRPYAKPTLQDYGSIAKLTQSGGTTTTETNPLMRTCL